MVSKLTQSYIHAREAILKIIPELRERIEKGNITHNIICNIARSVIAEKNEDGTISISESKLKDRNFDIPKRRINLIKEIYSQHIVGSTHKDVNITVSHKKQALHDDVDIVRGKNKRKADSKAEENISKLTKNQKQNESSSEPRLEDFDFFFDDKKGLPPNILKIATSYFDETIYVDMVKEGIQIPAHITKNITMLDLSAQDIDVNTFGILIEQFKDLKSLKLPSLAGCSMLSNGKYDTSSNLLYPWFKEISQKCPSLTSLDLSSCKYIGGIDGIDILTSLINLDLSGSFTVHRNITNLSDLNTLASLRNLNLSQCDKVDIMTLPALRSLTHLNLSNRLKCPDIYDISNLADLESLTYLNLSGCYNILDINNLEYLKSLTYLNLSGCKKIRDISVLAKLTNLRKLDLSLCVDINDISGLINHEFLENLNLHYCKNIIDISVLKTLKNLRKLDLSLCQQIRDISYLKGLVYLTDLNLRGCDISDISSLAHLKSLVNLNLRACNMSDISILTELESLTTLDLSWCQNITNISILLTLTSLRTLKLPDNIDNISSFEALTNLKVII